ncbi:MAG: DJ-1/PfpI family protein [Clostridia bacterium]|nr:DJ-1/PfpI family protein [Clostridia bacterium]
MIAILLADGFEEIEALTPLDLLRRAKLDARTVAVGSKIAVGSHGIPVIADMTADELKLSEVSMLILPGGMPGTLNLDASDLVGEAIKTVLDRGGRVAAICAAPLILGRRGYLEGKRAVCYPGFEDELKGFIKCNGEVVTDGNITTAKGMGVAGRFGYELLTLLIGKERATEICRGAIMEI